jgi:hypothetical protein
MLVPTVLLSMEKLPEQLILGNKDLRHGWRWRWRRWRMILLPAATARSTRVTKALRCCARSSYHLKKSDSRSAIGSTCARCKTKRTVQTPKENRSDRKVWLHGRLRLTDPTKTPTTRLLTSRLKYSSCGLLLGSTPETTF